MSNAGFMATRKAFGLALQELGARDDKVVVLDADLSKSTMSEGFSKSFPSRFFQMGIAEANMIGTAAGLALSGYTPFICSFACFVTGRFDQIKMSVAYSKARVRIVGTHAGLGVGPDGYSQQGLEDLALMRSLPGMLVLQPADDIETQQMVNYLATASEPAYLRLIRQEVPRVHNSEYQFVPGKFATLHEGNDLAIFATGGTVTHALSAAQELATQGIHARVINASSIKPLDVECIVRAARETRMLITAEDHTTLGGLGGAVTEVVCAHQPARVIRLGVDDIFGESGTPELLYAKHGIDAKGIYDRAIEAWHAI